MSRRRALVTGVTGQDGSYLAELLLEENYEVFGVLRRPGEPAPNIEAIRDELTLIPGDLSEPKSLQRALGRARPNELYHLAAPTFVPDSWHDPARTVAEVVQATVFLLMAARELDPTMRIYVPTSSEIFGDALESPQTELTVGRPTTPYGVAKLATHQMIGVLRRDQGLHVCSGITYNHESLRRPERFVTRKLSRAAAAIKLGREDHVALGDLDAVRDWSYAGDIVRGAWLALQADRPEDYVLASGVARTVRELAQVAFGCVGLDADAHVRVDPQLLRSAPATVLVGDASKARRELGWVAEVGFEEMIGDMVAADLRRETRGAGDP